MMSGFIMSSGYLQIKEMFEKLRLFGWNIVRLLLVTLVGKFALPSPFKRKIPSPTVPETSSVKDKPFPPKLLLPNVDLKIQQDYKLV